MADYEGFLTADQPWPFRLAYPDAWNISDAEPLAAPLQSSIAGSSSDGDVFSTENVDFLFSNNHEASPVQTPTLTPTSTGGSENEGFAPKQRRSVVPPRGGIAKRKSRPSKQASSTTTTFIAADPADFQRMVQEVTGARFAGEGGGLMLNPEVRRELNHPGASIGLATLDASAFWPNGSTAGLSSGSAEGRRCAEPICSFPTLESWKAA